MDGYGWVADLSGWALAALLFVMMASGRLVSVRTVEREQALLERVAEGWKAAHDTEQAQLGLILTEIRSRLPGPSESASGRPS